MALLPHLYGKLLRYERKLKFMKIDVDTLSNKQILHKYHNIIDLRRQIHDGCLR